MYAWPRQFLLFLLAAFALIFEKSKQHVGGYQYKFGRLQGHHLSQVQPGTSSYDRMDEA
jgi:hypothetical protein